MGNIGWKLSFMDCFQIKDTIRIRGSAWLCQSLNLIGSLSVATFATIDQTLVYLQIARVMNKLVANM